MIFHRGSHFTIVYADGAGDSRTTAEATIPKNSGSVAQMNALLRRLADTGKLKSPDQFRHEGEQIYAVKARGGFRAYGFFAPGRQFVVSHFIHKKKQKLDPADLRRAAAEHSRWKDK